MICPKCGKSTILRTCPDCGTATIADKKESTRTYTEGSWFLFGVKIALGIILIALSLFFTSFLGISWTTFLFIFVGIALFIWAYSSRPIKKTIIQQETVPNKATFPNASPCDHPKSSLSSTTSVSPSTTTKPQGDPKDTIQKHPFDMLVKDNILRYEYENKMFLYGCTPIELSGKSGKPLDFRPEPENEHDPKAIAIYLENKRIGYVYRGQTQDMIHDWIRRKELYLGYLNRIFIDEGNVTFKIGFYKPKEQFEQKTYSLVRTSKKIDDFSNRKENLENCGIGDVITAEYDDIIDSFVVYDYFSNEIGELPKAATTFLQAKEIDDVCGEISEYYTDDNDKVKASVDIYF